MLNRIASQVIEVRRGIHPEILKGVHNLRHTFGRRLHGAGIPLETRKALFGHAGGDITTHYSAAELSELLNAAEACAQRDQISSPTLTLVSRKAGKTVRQVSEKKKGQSLTLSNPLIIGASTMGG